MVKKQRNMCDELLNQQEEEFIANLSLEDDELREEQENSFCKETYDYDYDVETDYDPEKENISATQLNDCISFDSIKLRLPLIEAEYVGFEVERGCFFRSSVPERPTAEKEDMLHLLGTTDNQVPTMKLGKKEKRFDDKSMAFEYAKTKYPNAKPFYDYCRRLGIGHMYFKNGEFVCQINGKSTSQKGYLGLINKNNINQALNKLKGNLIRFDNDKFIEKAQVLLVHVTNDIKVSDTKPYIKAFSSYLPLRTDKYNVLKYGNNGYEILPRGKQSKSSAKHSLCIYIKGNEIEHQNQSSYKNKIGKEGLNLATQTLRLELKLYNHKAIRQYLAPEKQEGTITLEELLNCSQKPILQRLKELEITKENLIKSRGERIYSNDDKLPTLAELTRMHGLIHLLKLNDYSLDKVRSYLIAETGKNVRSEEIKKDREALQRYIACYKPRTVALLSELLAGMSY